MIKKRALVVALSLVALLGQAVVAKNMTIYDRQVALKVQVDKKQKENELTLKEADKLREKLEDINAKKEKMIAKNGGKLAYKDEAKLEKMLNSVSVDITKKSLAKRVEK